MAGQSYLGTRDIAAVDQARRDIIATRIAMQHDPAITILRQHPGSGVFNPLAPVTVDIVVPDPILAATTGSNESVISALVKGLIRKEAPFDVQAGDRFVTPEGYTASVTAVETSPAGIVSAWFEAETGAPR